MILEGVVTNVTAFGAFVDVGVHQDGLVHVSQLADRFIKDPHEAAKVGDKIKVRVLEIDMGRKRIALTAKSGDPAKNPQRNDAGGRPDNRSGGAQRPGGGNDRLARNPGSGERSRPQPQLPPQKAFTNNPFAQLLKR